MNEKFFALPQERPYTDHRFFEIICQRVLANCVFMREAPTIYLFALRALFEENPEIKGDFGTTIRRHTARG